MDKMERNAWIEEIVRLYENDIMQLCTMLLRNASLAEDATQETFLKAWRGADQFRSDASVKTWLIRIAVNVCRDLRKSAWTRHAVLMDTLPEGKPGIYSEQDETLTLAVMMLPDKLRQVVLLHYWQRLTVEETAEALSVSRSTVLRRLEKAKKQLKKEMEG